MFVISQQHRMALLLTLDEYLLSSIYRYVFDKCLKEIRPSEISEDGTFRWTKRGLTHRDVGPALIYPYGCNEWFWMGELHHKGDFPAVIDANGYKEWDRKGEPHRDGDLPAVISTLYHAWYKNGQLHRDGDQPAKIYADGRQEWWVNGQRVR